MQCGGGGRLIIKSAARSGWLLGHGSKVRQSGTRQSLGIWSRRKPYMSIPLHERAASALCLKDGHKIPVQCVLVQSQSTHACFTEFKCQINFFECSILQEQHCNLFEGWAVYSASCAGALGHLCCGSHGFWITRIPIFDDMATSRSLWLKPQHNASNSLQNMKDVYSSL